jgi:very-short-patch-repair endonuclease
VWFNLFGLFGGIGAMRAGRKAKTLTHNQPIFNRWGSMPFKKGHGPWHKGRKGLYHTSEETKRKLSELRKGAKNPFFGKYHTSETRRKLSELRKGKHYPKLSMARKGKHYPKLSEALKGKPHPTPWLKSKPRSNEVRRKISEAQKGRVFTEQHKQKLAVAHIEAMKRGCYNIRPNVPEKKFIEICAKYNLPFKYTGDGSYSIERMNPDFVEINGKKICVEVLGTYWHGPAKPKGNFEKRKQRLVEQGWTVIGIWERELKKLPEEEIVKRVLDQTNRIRMGRYIIDKEANR